jgi:hypothetical protein
LGDFQDTVVFDTDQLIAITAIYVKSWVPPKTFHKHIISLLSSNFTYWQEILSSRSYHCTAVFCDYIFGANIRFRDVIWILSLVEWALDNPFSKLGSSL